jgi:hypothetical protein
LARRDQRSSVSRSSSVKLSGALGRPVLAIRRHYNTSAMNFRRRTLDDCFRIGLRMPRGDN